MMWMTLRMSLLTAAFALSTYSYAGSQTSAGVPDLLLIDCGKTAVYKNILTNQYSAELEGEFIPNVSVFYNPTDRSLYVGSIRSHYGVGYQLEAQTDHGTPDGFPGLLTTLDENNEEVEEELVCPYINLSLIDA